MSQLIKNARIYTAHLPSADAMREHLAHETFSEPLSTQTASSGFVDMEQGTRVTEFPGGYAFRFRFAQKVIPGSVVKDELDARCAEVEASTGRKPGKKERRALKDEVIDDLAAQAFVRTTDVIAYFRTATNQLLVPTLSNTISDKLMSKLVSAVESVKTETIHVSNVTQGLTARLIKWLDDEEDAFGEFEPVNEVDLAEDKRSVRVKMSWLQEARSALSSSLAKGFSVNALGLELDGDEFKLTHDFKLRAITLAEPAETGAEETEDKSSFEAQAAIEVDRIGKIVDALVEMFQYADEADA